MLLPSGTEPASARATTAVTALAIDYMTLKRRTHLASQFLSHTIFHARLEAHDNCNTLAGHTLL